MCLKMSQENGNSFSFMILLTVVPNIQLASAACPGSKLSCIVFRLLLKEIACLHCYCIIHILLKPLNQHTVHRRHYIFCCLQFGNNFSPRFLHQCREWTELCWRLLTLEFFLEKWCRKCFECSLERKLAHGNVSYC